MCFGYDKPVTHKTDFKAQLIAAYDADAARRLDTSQSIHGWKLKAREKFAALAETEQKKTILELGAGAGLDAAYFKDRGFDVLATDLSPEMVEACKKTGVDTRVLDLYELTTLERQFDAIYAMNVLLHVPKKDLSAVLQGIYNTLTTNGIFFYGVYGGPNRETVITDPTRMGLPRLFSFLADETLLQVTTPLFDVIGSEVVDLGDDGSGLHFQSLLLRKKILEGSLAD